MEILLIVMYLSEYSGQEGASACTLQTLDLNHYMERGSCIRDFTLIPTKCLSIRTESIYLPKKICAA